MRPSRPALVVALLLALVLTAIPTVASAQRPFDDAPGDGVEHVAPPFDDVDDAGDEGDDDADGWPGGVAPEPTVPAPIEDVDPGGVIPVPGDGADDDPLAPADPWAPEEIEVPTTTKGSVPGRVAVMRRDGKAAIPRGAPKRVRQIIAAANRIVGKPYKWGGGHAKLEDRGYDCSGTVSYALIRAGLLRSPLVSGGFARRYAAGAGRYVSIHANTGHVYMEVAGLRLDTSAVGDRGGRKGVRWRPVIGRRKGFSTRHPVGL